MVRKGLWNKTKISPHLGVCDFTYFTAVLEIKQVSCYKQETYAFFSLTKHRNQNYIFKQNCLKFFHE